MPGSTVTIVRCCPTGITTVSGVRFVRKPATTTPSRSTSRRTYWPATSSPTGATSAVSRPRRAAATAVIAPPPGERMSSPAKRSSPGAGSPSSPTKVRSRKAGVVTASSMLSKWASLAERPPGVRVEVAQAPSDEAVGHRVARLRGRAALDAEHEPRVVSVADAEERLAPERLDVLDPAVEGAGQAVALGPRARVLGSHADDRVRRRPEVEAQLAHAREAHPRRADEAGHEHVGGRIVELGRRADLLEPPVVHDRDPVAHRHRLDLVVGDVDRRRPDPLLEALDLAARLDAQLGVEVGERLVHEEDLRVADERAAERDALLLAAGQLARTALEQLAELQRAGRAAHALVDLRLRRLAPPEREGEVVVDRHLRVQRVVLEHHRDVALARGDAVDHPLPDADLALGHGLEAGQHAQRRGLARAGGPDEHEELAVPGGERELAHGLDGIKALRDPVELDRGHG